MSVAEEIKARLDLVAYISETVSLKKAGRTFKARCPFHQERTPSFVVFPETQTWRCFGACGDGGDIFAFAMKQHGWDFKEALTNLAERAGVEIKARTPEEDAQDAAFERLLGLLEETARFFNRQLKEAPEAEIARAYVDKRALNAQTVESFLLGYAPDGWQSAINHLTDLGYAVADIIEAGVAIRNDQGRVYDRFRHRLMIPIRDGRGRVIGFGARALRDEDHPKYLNSPQTELFDKSSILFGLDMARREIRETETAVIVEGYMDVMQAHQAGFSNVVAQMGTALTDPQLQALRRYADRLILALDADQAGINATSRDMDLVRERFPIEARPLLAENGLMRDAMKLGFDTRILVVTSGKDPDDLIRENPAEWARLVKEAKPIVDYLIDTGLRGIDPNTATIYEKEKIARSLIPLLLATENDLYDRYNVQRLAMRLKVSEKSLVRLASEIALDSQVASSSKRTTDSRVRQRRPTQKMEEAAKRWKAPEPPPPQASRPAPREDWQEGPPPAYEEDMAPPEDGENGEVLPELDIPPRGAAYQPRQASLLEGYCLSILLVRPEQIYHIDRELRSAADSVKARFADERQGHLDHALASFGAEDFRDTGHQAILRALRDALRQDELDALDYVREAVGTAFHAQIDALTGLSQPLDHFQDRLAGPMRSELASVLKQMRREGRVMLGPESELVDKAFQLRRARLLAETEELRFLAGEAGPDDRRHYQDMIDANEAAIMCLDRALWRRAQLAQD